MPYSQLCPTSNHQPRVNTKCTSLEQEIVSHLRSTQNHKAITKLKTNDEEAPGKKRCQTWFVDATTHLFSIDATAWAAVSVMRKGFWDWAARISTPKSDCLLGTSCTRSQWHNYCSDKSNGPIRFLFMVVSCTVKHKFCSFLKNFALNYRVTLQNSSSHSLQTPL